ncbi:phage head-tail connector protein [Bacillus sp. JJ722]|uniref:phage head-tail connector protein n=1 Tax=Bacillus sp. JJ722 TaxID=3122973 RepID=UPI002FFDA309
MWVPTNEEVAEYKRLNQEKSAKKDDYYRSMIPIVLDIASGYCNQNFEHEMIPPKVKLFIAKVTQFNEQKAGRSSRKMGTVSEAYEVEVPKSFYKFIAPYRRLKFNGR